MAKSKRQFGNVRKLPSGRFQARYTDPRGKVITAPRTFRAKIHAESFHADVDFPVRVGDFVDVLARHGASLERPASLAPDLLQRLASTAAARD